MIYRKSLNITSYLELGSIAKVLGSHDEPILDLEHTLGLEGIASDHTPTPRSRQVIYELCNTSLSNAINSDTVPDLS